MTDQEITNYIHKHIRDVIHMSLATSRDDKPWACELHVANDDNLNLYFLSLPTSRHCEDVTINPHVAGTIVKQHQTGEKPQGIYFEGTAGLIGSYDSENSAFASYIERFQTDTEWLKNEYERPDGHRMYKVNVTDFYIFSDGKHHLQWGSND